MGRELGRISGPLLSENLLRNGTNLVFDTNLLLLNVSSKRLGINTLGPSRDLTVANGIDSVNLLVDTQSELANFVLTTNQIQNPLTTITITPNQSSPVITSPNVGTSLLNFGGNTISNSTADSNINITPSGTGIVNVTGAVVVGGGLHATGNITWDGNITFGNADTDTVTFESVVNSNIIPNVTNLRDFGSTDARWSNVRATNVYATVSGIVSPLNLTTANIGNFVISGNNIRNSNNDTVFSTSGTGNERINGFEYITDNTFTAYTSTLDSVFTIANTDNGYVKFESSTAMVIPVGTTQNYPMAPIIGAVRYNPELEYGEVFSGTVWSPVGGTSAVLTERQVNDAMWAWDLTLG